MKILLSVCFLIVCIIHCKSTHYSYAPTSAYVENDARQITDEDILKAFNAKPQIILPVKVALYNLSDDQLLEKLHDLKDIKRIAEIYEIPRTLIEGAQEDHVRYSQKKSAVDLKSLRLFSARAKNDILILFGSQLKVEKSPNAWAFLYLTLLGGLLSPSEDLTFEFSTECFVFDVRNGYMYKHIKLTLEKETIKYVFPALAEMETKAAKDRLITKAAPEIIKHIHQIFVKEKS